MQMSNYQTLSHNFEPVFDGNSEVLILGTFPSVKSRENHFYYGHPQNRFWKVMAAVWDWPVPETIEEKKTLLYANHVAVWDVIGSCNITGSSDASIRDVVPNDLSVILEHASIRHIYANGGKSYEMYQKYIYPVNGRAITKLPSTSPANAAFSLERLVEEWKEIRE